MTHYLGARRVLLGRQYRPNAVNFDGTNDYLTRAADLTGNADGKQWLFSCWVNFASAGNGVLQYPWATRNAAGGGGIGFLISKETDNKIAVQGRNAAGTLILLLVSTSTYTDASGWLHILTSGNLATTTGQLYIDDVDDLAASPIITNDTLDFTKTEHTVGAENNGTAGQNKFNGDMADCYVNYATSLDLAAEINRRKFINASLKPVDLGSDGSTPTGSAPIVFLSNPTATFQNNLGPGGGMNENGALSDALTSPSD